jgi:hypothetical protein
MARPKKDNAEYFPHEAGMRNDDRIKAIRRKFKLPGYAIWNMLIEYLAGKENFRFEYTEFTLEIIAGDFDAEVKEIQDVISYCLTLGLLQQADGFIVCNRLEKGLQPLLSKRKRDRERVTAVENPQSKVKESKGEERKEEERIKIVPREAINLIESISKYFAVTQDVMNPLYDSISDFVETIFHGGRLASLIISFEKYTEYKARSQEMKHSVTAWIGTKDNHYKDGQWSMINWSEKLLNHEQQLGITKTGNRNTDHISEAARDFAARHGS